MEGDADVANTAALRSRRQGDLAGDHRRADALGSGQRPLGKGLPGGGQAGSQTKEEGGAPTREPRVYMGVGDNLFIGPNWVRWLNAA